MELEGICRKHGKGGGEFLTILLFTKMIFDFYVVIRLSEPVHNNTINERSKTFYVLYRGFDMYYLRP
jgi:hypothetical protein